VPVQPHGPKPYDRGVDDAIRSIAASLVDTEVNRVWRTHELRDRIDGRRHALPLLVSTDSGLWVVEVLTRGGNLRIVDDVWHWERGGQHATMSDPRLHVRDTASRLRALLDMHGLRDLPVRPLVLLAPSGQYGVRLVAPRPHHSLDLATLEPDADRKLWCFADVLQEAQRKTRNRVTPPLARKLADTLPNLGVSEVQAREVAGGYRMGRLLVDADVWQEHEGVNLQDPADHVRVRTWVVPGTDDPARRSALQRAALREVEVLERVGRHPHILRLRGSVDHAGVSRLVFEGFETGLTLDTFLKAHPDLSFSDRLRVLEQVGQALDHCHRSDIYHRNLGPDAVLVRLEPDQSGTQRPAVRLHHFEGAVAIQAERTRIGTRHLSHFSARKQDLYRAPELERDPDAVGARSDLFSLGALGFLLFSSRNPGPMALRDKMLREQEHLDLLEVTDDLDDDLVAAIAEATAADPIDRPASVRAWIGEVLGLYRVAAQREEAVHPLLAGPGDALGDGLTVEAVLGTGASARVLAVRRDDDLRALKVPLDQSSIALIEQEHRVLAGLQRREKRHSAIVRIDDLVRLQEIPCLLMQHAGHETLDARVRREGALPLDYAHRLGVELLGAIEFLHGAGVQHRDLKPANLAFTSRSNKAHALVLFDFSLSGHSRTDVRAGTPRWRDPMLGERGAWDDAADLYAGAAILHFALTGERPRWSEARRGVQIADSRFDPDLRGALRGFFERAFAPKLGDRYPDAEAMRRSWQDIFVADVTSVGPSPDDPGATPDDPRLVRARLDTPIGALGLSARALNALERAGVAIVRDLLGLPRNRLSLVRGVGKSIRDEIRLVVAQLEQRLGARHDAVTEPFLPATGLPRIDLAEAELGLTSEALAALQDAGLRTTLDLAEATESRVARLVARHAVDIVALRAALSAVAPDRPLPGMLGDHVIALLRPTSQKSRRKAWERRLGVLTGLDPLPNGAADVAPAGGRSNAQVAAALGVTPIVFRSSFQSSRNHWEARRTESDAAIAYIGAALDSVGPVASIPEVADALLRAHAPDQRSDARAHRQAVALVRWGTEVDVPRAPFLWRRLGDHAWLARDASLLDALAHMAAAADRLATGDRPVPLDAADRALREAGPAASALTAEARVQRAVAASTRAALSPRMEIYPRGLSADRALELTGAVLGASVTPEDVQKRVRARFPLAAALPDRPDLDRLLGPVGLRWSTDRGAYVRPGAPGATLTRTGSWRTSVASTTGLRGRTLDPSEVRAERFQLALDTSLEGGRFRAIQVAASAMVKASEALHRAVPELTTIDLDTQFLLHLQAEIEEAGAESTFVNEIDRAGPEGEHWDVFVEEFVTPAATVVFEELLTPEARARPQLLVHPGLLARYRLTAPLDAFVQRVEAEPGQAVWLLLPAWDDGSRPAVRHPLGDLAVPTWLEAQRLRAPRAWVRQVLG
jgi:serine/threonine protein kinase